MSNTRPENKTTLHDSEAIANMIEPPQGSGHPAAAERGRDPGHRHGDHGHTPKTLRAAPDNALIDPVCGMTVAPDAPHHAQHQGHDYRFCSAGCRAKFIADPARYLKPKIETATTDAATGEIGRAHV